MAPWVGCLWATPACGDIVAETITRGGLEQADAGSEGSCNPCVTDDDCAGDRCVVDNVTLERTCVRSCSSEAECPAGSNCQAVVGGSMACVPSALACDGSEAYGADGTVELVGCSSIAGGSGLEPGGVIPVCCTPDAVQQTDIDQLWALLDEHRGSQGVPSLQIDPNLGAAAQAHCRHMALHGFFGNVAPEPSVASFDLRAKTCGSEAAAELIASSASSPAEALTSWQRATTDDPILQSPALLRAGAGQHGPYYCLLLGA